MQFNKNEHPEWHLEHYNTVDIPAISLDDAPATIVTTFTIRRKATFFAVVLIFPSCILNFLSLLIFALSYIDVDCRLDLALNIFVSYFVLLTVIVASMPSCGDSVPRLGVYFAASTAIVTFCLLVSLLIKKLYNNSESGTEMYHCCKWILRLINRTKGNLNHDQNRSSYTRKKHSEDEEQNISLRNFQHSKESLEIRDKNPGLLKSFMPVESANNDATKSVKVESQNEGIEQCQADIKAQRQQEWLTLCNLVNCCSACIATLCHILCLVFLISIIAED